MTNPASEPDLPAGDEADPARRQEPEPTKQADGEERKETAKDAQATDSPDEVEEETLSPEEERAQRNEIRKFRAAGLESLQSKFAFGGATSFGGYAAERDINNINYYLGTTRRESAIAPVPADELADLRTVHVPFKKYEVAQQMLMKTRILVLSGEEGSGRRTSALALLAGLVDNRIFDLGQDHDLESLLDREREENCGYVLHSVPSSGIGKLTQSKLSLAASMLENSGSFLVITVSNRSEARYGNLERYLVDHWAPDLNRVIRSHLRWQCAEFPELLEDWLADSHLVEQAKIATQPIAMAKLADALAKALKDGKTLNDALNYWGRESVLSEARRLLHAVNEPDPDFQPSEQLQRCAFLIALAVFNDAPYLSVAAAAESLAELLIKVTYPNYAPNRKIFGLRRNDWKYWLQADVERRQRKDRWGEQSIEHIRLLNPELPSALLNELWHQYDAARTPVLHWLRNVASRRSAELQVRAAQVVGTLATDDFEYVYEEVIFGWAGSRSASQRDAAAWALEVAVVTGEAQERVRQLLGEWCRTGSKYRKLTAVTAYGTQIGADSPEAALHSLRNLARSEDPELTKIAYNSVVDLFAAGQHDQVLDTLQEWLTGTDVTACRFAVASLVEIAYLHDENGWPVLLPMCAGGHPRAGLLAELWRRGLTDDYTRANAWDALWRWFRDADQHHELLAPLEHLVKTLESADDDLQTRITWYLGFWAAHSKAPSVTASQIRSTSRKE